jgi:DNA segregation ATPase FtsK/SpoIIIE-like protein
MAVSVLHRALLDRQADRIEQVFSELALPIRVLGGEVHNEEVRYHLSPHTPATLRELEDVSEAVARSLGEPGLSILRERETIALSIPVDVDRHLRLLPLLNVMGVVPEMHAVLGMGADNKPLALNLQQGHLLILGPKGCGKSELLRTILFSLALNNRQSQLQVLGIDLSGRELAALDALPHTLAELATEPEFAGGLLLWLRDEMERREVYRVVRPNILLVIDDVDRLVQSGPEHVQETLHFIAHQGVSRGVHLILTSNAQLKNQLLGLFRSKPTLLLGKGLNHNEIGTVGRFVLETGRTSKRLQAAWLPVADIHAAVALCRSSSNGGR